MNRRAVMIGTMARGRSILRNGWNRNVRRPKAQQGGIIQTQNHNATVTKRNDDGRRVLVVML